MQKSARADDYTCILCSGERHISLSVQWAIRALHGLVDCQMNLWTFTRLRPGVDGEMASNHCEETGLVLVCINLPHPTHLSEPKQSGMYHLDTHILRFSEVVMVPANKYLCCMGFLLNRPGVGACIRQLKLGAFSASDEEPALNEDSDCEDIAEWYNLDNLDPEFLLSLLKLCPRLSDLSPFQCDRQCGTFVPFISLSPVAVDTVRGDDKRRCI